MRKQPVIAITSGEPAGIGPDIIASIDGSPPSHFHQVPARLFSVDYSSGSLGGDIGWNEPGSTVLEYESVASQLDPGQISEPFRSQFGWHLMEVTGRRTIDETEESKFNKIHAQLLQQRRIEAFDIWKRRLREEAYVLFPGPDA